MDPIQAIMAGMFLAKEIMQLINSQKEITEEQLALLIAGNLVKLQTTIDTIKAEMAATK